MKACLGLSSAPCPLLCSLRRPLATSESASMMLESHRTIGLEANLDSSRQGVEHPDARCRFADVRSIRRCPIDRERNAPRQPVAISLRKFFYRRSFAGDPLSVHQFGQVSDVNLFSALISCSINLTPILAMIVGTPGEYASIVRENRSQAKGLGGQMTRRRSSRSVCSPRQLRTLGLHQ